MKPIFKALLTITATLSVMAVFSSCSPPQRGEMTDALNGARQLQLALRTYVMDRQVVTGTSSSELFPDSLAELDPYLSVNQIDHLNSLGDIELLKPSSWPNEGTIVARLTTRSRTLNITWGEGFQIEPR